MVVGGLSLSAILTLGIVPPLMSVFLGLRAAHRSEAAHAFDSLDLDAPEPARAAAGGGPDVAAPAPAGDPKIVAWPKLDGAKRDGDD